MFSDKKESEGIYLTLKNATMTKERWEGILAFKKQFLADSSVDPLTCPYLDRMVAESWKKSRSIVNDPYKKTARHYLSQKQYEELPEISKLLIEVAKPLFDVFNNLIRSSNYVMHLIGTNGANLINENSLARPPLTSNMTDSPSSLYSNECTNTTTCAHELAIQYKQPVQLFGPEHYLVELENFVVSAAPIFDENNEVIAALFLEQTLNDTPWTEEYQTLCAHALGLITAMAKAIEAQLKLHKSYKKLEENNHELSNANRKILTANNLLSTTLSLIDEGIITIDCQGNILEINQTARKMLQIPPQQKEKINIAKYLTEDSLLLKWVSEGKNISHKEEVFHIGDKTQTYIVSMKLVLGENKNVELAVLRFQNSITYNLHATKRAGTDARFRFEDMIGESAAFKEAFSLAKKFAKSEANILLIGESGTGKELFAQSMHNIYRPEGPFIALNCAAIPRTLIESELFGYESGSFTGADRTGRPGKIELADKGTLFLDEIGDMPLDIQAVLLRVLEDKKVMRIGGRKQKNVDFRVIAATNKDLRKMVQEKTFREDLYFRLSVLKLKIPPLRERTGDIERLTQYFLSNYCRRFGELKVLDEKAMQLLKSYDWPGNIRQLENAIVYGISISEGSVIETRHLPEDILTGNNHELNVSGKPTACATAGNLSTLQEIERNAIRAALEQTNNNISKTAKILDISISTLYRRMKEFK